MSFRSFHLRYKLKVRFFMKYSYCWFHCQFRFTWIWPIEWKESTTRWAKYIDEIHIQKFFDVIIYFAYDMYTHTYPLMTFDIRSTTDILVFINIKMLPVKCSNINRHKKTTTTIRVNIGTLLPLCAKGNWKYALIYFTVFLNLEYLSWHFPI